MLVSRVSPILHRRHFVSTLLLSRTWEIETVVELRKEAKARGLSTKGNKSTLISRIKEHDGGSVRVTSASPSTHASPTTRGASTNTAPPKKVSQAASPGIPLAAQLDSASTRSDFLAVRLPDLSKPPPREPVQIPYVPDFWDSARPSVPLVPGLPNLHVVGRSATLYGGGLMHHPEAHKEDATSHSSSKEVDLLANFRQSLGPLKSFSICRALSEAGNSASRTGQDESRTYSRPLTNEEKKGLYILLGILGGSWLVGGFVNRKSDVPEEHSTENQY